VTRHQPQRAAAKAGEDQRRQRDAQHDDDDDDDDDQPRLSGVKLSESAPMAVDSPDVDALAVPATAAAAAAAVPSAAADAVAAGDDDDEEFVVGDDEDEDGYSPSNTFPGFKKVNEMAVWYCAMVAANGATAQKRGRARYGGEPDFVNACRRPGSPDTLSTLIASQVCHMQCYSC
jgi:hypothetical protein